MTKTTDLFEVLKNLCGCEYISDLRYEPYISKARLRMQTLCTDSFSLFQLSDMAEYLYEKRLLRTERKQQIFSNCKEREHNRGFTSLLR